MDKKKSFVRSFFKAKGKKIDKHNLVSLGFFYFILFSKLSFFRLATEMLSKTDEIRQ